MKWTFVIQQKIRAALVLGGIMALIIFFTFKEKKNINGLKHSVTSIYKDRLVPATDIFYLSEHLYNKRFLTERLLMSDLTDLAAFQSESKDFNHKINALIAKFEQTYLVDEESQSLKELKRSFTRYVAIERRMLTLLQNGSTPEARKLYQYQGQPLLQHTSSVLSKLARIQTTVGSELIKDSDGKVASSAMISDLLIVLSIITGLVLIAMVFSNRLVEGREKNFHWN